MIEVIMRDLIYIMRSFTLFKKVGEIVVDIATLKYKVVIVDSKKKRYNITDYIQSLSWEENENEISSRITFDTRNDKTSKGYLSAMIKLGCLVLVYAKHGNQKYKEVARGEVVSWNPVKQSSSRNFKCTCYDQLYNLQKSQDNFFFKSGTSTKSRIKRVFTKWKIPIGKYDGPNKKHGKKKYQNQYLSDILLGILDDAVKKGGKKSVIRMEKGKVSIVPQGSNSDVYVFQGNNTKVISRNKSTADLVTRVKIIGKSKEGGKNKVVATLNGLTQYGVRQRIYTRSSDESVKEAKKAAQEILNDSGVIKKEVTVQSPDVPYIRKGDFVYMNAGALKGYYVVLGIQHDASTFSMSMDIELSDKSKVSKNKQTKSGNYKVGEVVNFKGGKHYVSSSGNKGFSAKAGNAKITRIVNNAKHPYHLIHTNKKSNVYGWVDEGTFS